MKWVVSRIGLALCSKQLQPLPHQVAGLRIEAGGRLVEHQHARVVHHSARDRKGAGACRPTVRGLGIGLCDSAANSAGRDALADLRVLHPK